MSVALKEMNIKVVKLVENGRRCSRGPGLVRKVGLFA